MVSRAATSNASNAAIPNMPNPVPSDEVSSGAVTQYSVVDLRGLPRLDRFFPDCGLGLVEFVTGLEHGFPDLKKVWFGNTFEYRRSEGAGWLNANGVELAATFSVTRDVREKAFERLGKYFQVEVHMDVVHGFDALLRAVHQTMSRGLPAISSFDMSFLQEPGRSNGNLQPHMIGIVGLNVPESRLRIVDQVRGEVSVPLEQLEHSFRRFAEHRQDFCLLRCERKASGASLPLDRDVVLECVRGAVQNLRSREPHLGLNALKQAVTDVEAAIEAEQKAFAIPGQWIFSHDRHALKKALPYWSEAGVAGADHLAELDSALGRAFTTWFEIDMTIERAIHGNEVARMRRASRLLSDVVRLEEALTVLLERVAL
jgi:hypothetical protein